jgi:pSer/pThr/pTyr-binding forkhead associated (FHA) protein
VLSIKEIRALARALDVQSFQAQLGPFVLIQRPPEDEADAPAHPASGIPLRTVYVPPADIRRNVFTLLSESFDDLQITTLPPLEKTDELIVGRLPDCDVMVEHPSASKRHAVLRWNQQGQRCTVKDLGSTNGTYLNDTELLSEEVALSDGDIVSFGDAQFWFLLTRTLWDKMATGLEATSSK